MENLDIIKNLIKNYFELEKGVYTENYEQEIEIINLNFKVYIKHKVLKHIVEKRKEDNYILENIYKIFEDLQRIVISNKYKIIKNKEKIDNTFLLIEIPENNKAGVVMVLEILLNYENIYFVKTGFYRSTNKIKKLLK